jgi:hypothetical protein
MPKYTTERPYRYETACKALATALADFRVLAGENVGPSGASLARALAETCAVNLRHLASLLDAAREGHVVNGPAVFPSVSEALAGVE